MAWIGYTLCGGKWVPLKDSPNALIWKKNKVINNYISVLGKPIINNDELIYFKKNNDELLYVFVDIKVPQNIHISIDEKQPDIKISTL